MSLLYVFAILVLVVAGIIALIASWGEGARTGKPKYNYTAKRFFLTRAERELYDVLGQVVGHEYRIFAQVHLSSILNHKVEGQNWHAAFKYVNGKSIDFLLCDKEYLSPKLAIELDDKSHEREDRKERDIEVERIFKEAGIPLLRIPNRGVFVPSDVANQIRGMFAR